MSAWHELIVVGGEKPLRAFVAGFLGGRGKDEPILVGRDLGIETTTLRERLHDLLAAGSHHVLLAPAAVAAPLAAALRRRGPEAGLSVASHREVTAASLSFSVEAFSPEVAARVRSELHEALPPGVVTESFSEREERDGDARGAELYAPAHSFVYRASGRIAGAVPGVLEMRRRAGELPFVTVKAVALETREIAPAR